MCKLCMMDLLLVLLLLLLLLSICELLFAFGCVFGVERGVAMEKQKWEEGGHRCHLPFYPYFVQIT